MCLIARDATGNHPRCRNIHNKIDGGAFALSSSPRLITIYTSCKRGRNRGHDTRDHTLGRNQEQSSSEVAGTNNIIKGGDSKDEESIGR